MKLWVCSMRAKEYSSILFIEMRLPTVLPNTLKQANDIVRFTVYCITTVPFETKESTIFVYATQWLKNWVQHNGANICICKCFTFIHDRPEGVWLFVTCLDCCLYKEEARGASPSFVLGFRNQCVNHELDVHLRRCFRPPGVGTCEYSSWDWSCFHFAWKRWK